MVPRENKNNAYAIFEQTNKEYYGIFRTSLSVKSALKALNRKTILQGFVVAVEAES